MVGVDEIQNINPIQALRMNIFFSNFQTKKGLFRRITKSKNITSLNDLNWFWIISENRKSAKFSISKIFIFNDGTFKIILSEIKSNDFLTKTKSGEDFFHLAVVVTQFGDRPSPEMSMSDLMVDTRELKKTAKGTYQLFRHVLPIVLRIFLRIQYKRKSKIAC